MSRIESRTEHTASCPDSPHEHRAYRVTGGKKWGFQYHVDAEGKVAISEEVLALLLFELDFRNAVAPADDEGEVTQP